MPENPLIEALRLVFGPMVERTKDWPPVLAFGLPLIVAVLLIAVLSPFLSTGVLLLVGAVIFMVLLAYIGAAVVEGRGPGTEHQNPCATITHPIKDETVDRTILCTGTASGIEADKHLWLTVETYDNDNKILIWPKEGELVVDKAHKWSRTIFEHGATQQFAIAVYLADNVGDQFIREWLGAGRLKGGYSNLYGIIGADRLTRVDGLTLRNLGTTQAKTKTGAV